MNGSTEVYIAAGADFICNTTATGDDLQIAPVGQTEPGPLLGWDDWSNIKYRAALSVDAGGAAFEHGPDITAEEAARMRRSSRRSSIPTSRSTRRPTRPMPHRARP